MPDPGSLAGPTKISDWPSLGHILVRSKLLLFFASSVSGRDMLGESLEKSLALSQGADLIQRASTCTVSCPGAAGGEHETLPFIRDWR